MAILKTFRHSGTTCNLVYSEMGDRVQFSFGDVLGRRESLKSVKGNPDTGEILASVCNVSFFIPHAAANESILGADFTGLKIVGSQIEKDPASRFTAGHVIVENGFYKNVWPKEFDYIRGVNPRTIIGCTYTGRIFQFVCNGRKLFEKGLAFYDYEKLVLELEKYMGKIKFMVNCDGGGSSGIRFDGKVYGPYDGRTIGVFLEIYSPIGNNLPTLRRGARGQYVVYLQQLLNKHGYGLVCDGDFGNITLDAVRRFQSKNKLVADGIVGKLTWGCLQ